MRRKSFFDAPQKENLYDDFKNKSNQLNDLINENLCQLGQWINSKNIDFEDFSRLKEVHKLFHISVGEYIANRQINNTQAANKNKDEVLKYSNQIIQQLEKMKMN